ncbi:pinin [Pectinophora gossypiella]|nr:pinin [Pectinophora gossypiella]
MGTEVALSFSALRAQLENEKSSLYKIDENIKKIVQTSGRFSNNDRFNSSGEYPRGGARPGSRNSFSDANKNDELFGKRKHETKTVFSRLSARVQDSDGEEDSPGGKRARMPSAVSRELPTRAAVLRAQGDDEQARTRNRRIFGSLLGTLQKFKQEEIVLQTKEEKKAQVERKIEEQARLEKEREQKERKNLFQERDQRKATIKALEAKMARVQEFEKWEASQKSLSNFILTKARPHIYWLPKKMTDKANEKLNSSRKFHEKCMSNKRAELQEELQRIEQRCLRRGPGAKENDPETPHDEKIEDKRPRRKDSETSETGKSDKDMNDDKGRKRDKFAMDVDDKYKEDSDGEDRHEVPPKPDIDPKEEKESDDSKLDTSVEQDTSMPTEPSPGVTQELLPTCPATTNESTTENHLNNTNGEAEDDSQHS